MHPLYAATFFSFSKDNDLKFLWFLGRLGGCLKQEDNKGNFQYEQEIGVSHVVATWASNWDMLK